MLRGCQFLCPLEGVAGYNGWHWYVRRLIDFRSLQIPLAPTCVCLKIGRRRIAKCGCIAPGKRLRALVLGVYHSYDATSPSCTPVILERQLEYIFMPAPRAKRMRSFFFKDTVEIPPSLWISSATTTARRPSFFSRVYLNFHWARVVRLPNPFAPRFSILDFQNPFPYLQSYILKLAPSFHQILLFSMHCFLSGYSSGQFNATVEPVFSVNWQRYNLLNVV